MVEWVTNGGRTSAIDSVGKRAAEYVDSSIRMGGTNQISYGYNSVSSRTWNKELAKKAYASAKLLSLMERAWYAPACDLHRSRLQAVTTSGQKTVSSQAGWQQRACGHSVHGSNLYHQALCSQRKREHETKLTYIPF